MRRSARTGRDSRAKWPIRGHFGCDRRPMTTSIALPTDPRPAFATAVGTAVDAMGAVRPDQLSGPTPCTEFDVRTLLGHLLSVLRRVAAVGRGESPFSVPQVSTDVPDDGWGAAARAAADDVLAVWATTPCSTASSRCPTARTVAASRWPPTPA